MEKELEHHRKQELCYTRPAYREARWERAVKVYTINLESRYLLVQNVPALGVVKEVLELFSLYGDIEEHRLLDEYPAEEYTDVFFIKYRDINDARVAKRKLDNRSFFGKQLHISYAPEFETVQDTRNKIQQRRRVIAQKTRGSWESTQREAASTMKDGSQSSMGKVVSDGASPLLAAVDKSISHAHTACGTYPELQITPKSGELTGSGDQQVTSVARETPIAAVTLPGLPSLPLLPLPPLPSRPLLSAEHRHLHGSVTTAASKPSSSVTVSTIACSARQIIPAQKPNLKQKNPSKQSKVIAGLTKEERIALHMEECSNVSCKTTIQSPMANKGSRLPCASSSRGREKKIPLARVGLIEDVSKRSKPHASRSLQDTADSTQECFTSTCTSVTSCSSRYLPSIPEFEQLPVSSTPYPLLPLPAGPSNRFGQPLAPQPPESITGHRSLDSTISSVRARMDQVFKRPNLDVSVNKHGSKRRKRI